MIALKQRLHEDPQRLLDQLADHELSADDRRELLAALEEEPDGWRRCALAFIEAQVWREDLCAMPEGGAPAMPPVTRANSLLQTRGRERWPFAVALASSVLVAFAVARYAATTWPNRSVAMSTAVSTETRTVESLAPDAAPTDNAALVDNAAPTDSAGQALPAWETVQVSIEGTSTDGRKIVEVPCMDVARIDPQWLEQLDSAIPSPLLKTLRETGHTVKTDCQWWPIQLTDGRHVVLPVEQVEVEYVGGETY